MTPEAKKRMEEFIDKEFPTQWDDGSCRYSEFQRDLVRDGYQAADQANKELLLECEMKDTAKAAPISANEYRLYICAQIRHLWDVKTIDVEDKLTHLRLVESYVKSCIDDLEKKK